MFSLGQSNLSTQVVAEPNFDIELEVDGKFLNSSEVLAVGTAISYLKRATSQLIISEGQKELKFKIWYYNLLKYSAMVLLPLILFSVIIYFKIHSDIEELESAHLLQNTSSMEFKAVKSVIDKKLELISETGISKQLDAAYCLDKLGASLPTEIILNRIVVYPVVGDLQRDEPVDINYEQIIVLGQSPNTTLLNNWIREVEMFPWVQKVNIFHYQSDELHPGEFQLTLNLSDFETEL